MDVRPGGSLTLMGPRARQDELLRCCGSVSRRGRSHFGARRNSAAAPPAARSTRVQPTRSSPPHVAATWLRLAMQGSGRRDAERGEGRPGAMGGLGGRELPDLRRRQQRVALAGRSSRAGGDASEEPMAACLKLRQGCGGGQEPPGADRIPFVCVTHERRGPRHERPHPVMRPAARALDAPSPLRPPAQPLSTIPGGATCSGHSVPARGARAPGTAGGCRGADDGDYREAMRLDRVLPERMRSRRGRATPRLNAYLAMGRRDYMGDRPLRVQVGRRR